ncbi:MAG: HIT domain-containing protein [bacterium]|nr:HIT domain-containing protein [bacterium]
MLKKVVDLRFAKTKDYRKTLETIQKKGKCPFCPENFIYHKNPILKKNGDWLITLSSWPYKNSEYHFLIISLRHKEKFSALELADFGSVMKLVVWAEKKFKIKGGGLVLRFGDTAYTGSTVCHLHFHLIVPKLNKKTKRANAVWFPIG